MTRRLGLVVLLAGCDATATYTCTYAYTFDTGVETGTFTSNALTCDEYREAGDQIRNGDWDACEAAGLDRGASAATCDCPWDAAACPGDAND